MDFRRGEIHVRKQSSPDGKSLVEVKTAASVRTTPVPQAVIDAIAEQLAGTPRGHDDSVWIRGNVLLHTRNSIDRALARIVELHELPPTTMHDLRHYYASSLIAAGVPVPEVQSALGHASSATTLNVYTHLWPGSKDVTRRAAEGALRDVTVVRDQCGTSDSDKGAQAAD